MFRFFFALAILELSWGFYLRSCFHEKLRRFQRRISHGEFDQLLLWLIGRRSNVMSGLGEFL